MNAIEHITFTLPGEPRAMPRPNTVGRSRKTPAWAKAHKEALGWARKAAYRGELPEGPCSVEISARFAVPKSWPKWQREMALVGEWPHIVKPDNDNLEKMVFDALLPNDQRIFSNSTDKAYSAEPRTVVTMTFYEMPKKDTT